MILELRNLTKAFGGLVAINKLEFSVDEGEIIGLIGPNGYGKTTSFNLISGFLKPDIGTIFFEGKDITGLKPHKICHGGIARTFQLTKPLAGLTTLQNVMIGRMYGGKVRGRMREVEKDCEQILEFAGWAEKRTAMAAALSVVE